MSAQPRKFKKFNLGGVGRETWFNLGMGGYKVLKNFSKSLISLIFVFFFSFFQELLKLFSKFYYDFDYGYEYK